MTTLIDAQFRLEDYSRRSACDRCRDQKLRCERPASTGSGHLTQCRRCVMGQVRCLTTFEARPERNQPQSARGKGTGQPRKRHREASSNNPERTRDTQEGPNLCFLPDTSADTFIGSRPPLNASDKDEVRPDSQQKDPQQQQDFRPENQWIQSVQNNGSSNYREPTQRSAPSSANVQFSGTISATTSSGTNPAVISEVGLNQDNENPFGTFYDFVEDWDSFDLSNPTTETESSEQQKAVDKDISNGEGQLPNTAMLLNGPAIDERVRQPPSQQVEDTNPVDSALDRIMMLSVALSQESRCAKKHAMPGPRLKVVLTKTLQQSEAFIALLKHLVSLATNRQSQEMLSQGLHKQSDSSQSLDSPGSSRGPPTELYVDTQAALHLLSCNASLLSNFEVIGSILYEMVTTRAAENASILPHLPEVYMDGFSGVSSSLQVKILTQVCVHMVIEMQAGLNAVRDSGLLTFVSSKPFDALLGQDKDSQLGDEYSGNALTPYVVQLMHKIGKALGHSL